MTVPAPAADRKIFADYFTSFQTRDYSGASENWRYYHGDKVAWSGDLYETPGSDRKETATPYYPLIGPYDTADPDVLEYHILTAKLAGIDGFLCEYGVAGGHDGQVPVRMARLGKKYGFQVGIHWVPMNFTSRVTCVANRVEMLSAAKTCLLELMNNVYQVAGATLDQRPLLLIFGARAADYLPTVVRDTHFSASEIKALRASVAEFDPVILTPHFQPELLGTVDGFYPWVLPFGASVPPRSPFDRIGDLRSQTHHLRHFYTHAQDALKNKTLSHIMGGCWPGFDDHRGRAWGEDLARYVPREKGRMLELTWTMAEKAKVDTLLQVTWNDWVESTGIEPSREFGFKELEATQKKISAWKSLPLSPAHLRQPLRLYQARQMLRLLKRMGKPPRTFSVLQQQADALGLALSQSHWSDAEQLAARLESTLDHPEKLVNRRRVSACWRANRSTPDLKLKNSKNQKPRLLTQSRVRVCPFSGQLSLTVSTAICRRLAGRLLTGRLAFTYLDSGRHCIRVSQQTGPQASQRTLALFRKSNSRQWRTAEMDLLPVKIPAQSPQLCFRLDSLAETEPEYLRDITVSLESLA